MPYIIKPGTNTGLGKPGFLCQVSVACSWIVASSVCSISYSLHCLILMVQRQEGNLLHLKCPSRASGASDSKLKPQNVDINVGDQHQSWPVDGHTQCEIFTWTLVRLV